MLFCTPNSVVAFVGSTHVGKSHLIDLLCFDEIKAATLEDSVPLRYEATEVINEVQNIVFREIPGAYYLPAAFEAILRENLKDANTACVVVDVSKPKVKEVLKTWQKTIREINEQISLVCIGTHADKGEYSHDELKELESKKSSLKLEEQELEKKQKPLLAKEDELKSVINKKETQLSAENLSPENEKLIKKELKEARSKLSELEQIQICSKNIRTQISDCNRELKQYLQVIKGKNEIRLFMSSGNSKYSHAYITGIQVPSKGAEEEKAQLDSSFEDSNSNTLEPSAEANVAVKIVELKRRSQDDLEIKNTSIPYNQKTTITRRDSQTSQAGTEGGFSQKSTVSRKNTMYSAVGAEEPNPIDNFIKKVNNEVYRLKGGVFSCLFSYLCLQSNIKADLIEKAVQAFESERDSKKKHGLLLQLKDELQVERGFFKSSPENTSKRTLSDKVNSFKNVQKEYNDALDHVTNPRVAN